MKMSFAKAKRFLAVGEIMLRLTPPNHGLLRSFHKLEAQYGGSEANIAVALSCFGMKSGFMSVVPDHAIGRGACQYLEQYGVDCSKTIRSTAEETPTWRLGSYFLEKGYGIRTSKVVYDRKHSAVTEYDYDQIDFDTYLEGYDWIHLSGITLALGANGRKLVMSCLKAAKKRGMLVSFDGNFRGSLWSWEEARDACTECLPYVDVLFGIEPYHLYKDAAHPELGDVKDGLSMQPSKEAQQAVFEAFKKAYPNIRCMARHVRESHSDSENSLKAYVWCEGEMVESRKITFNVLDRVGGGDAFAAGLIYSLMQGYDLQTAADFAVANSALKATIHGDAGMIDDPQQVMAIFEKSDIKR